MVAPQRVEFHSGFDPHEAVVTQGKHARQSHAGGAANCPRPEHSAPSVGHQRLRSKAGPSRPVHSEVLLWMELLVFETPEVVTRAALVTDAQQDPPVSQSEQVRARDVLVWLNLR